MTVIHRLGHNIVKKIDKKRYEMEIDDDLMKSINKKDFSNFELSSQNTFYFTASSVQTLAQYTSHTRYMKFDNCLKLLQDLGNQLVNLERNDKTIAFYALDDIIVISDNLFVFMNSNKIFEIDNDNIVINIPLQTNKGFLSPELLGKDTLPIKVNFKAAYYSLGSLIIYCLLKKTTTKDHTELTPIIYTNLYYFLKRCLQENPKKRFLLYI